MVDAHDKHGGISTGCRDDHPLGTTLQVSLRVSLKIALTHRRIAPRNSFSAEQNTYGGLLNGGKHTSGLNHILGTSLTPFNVSGVPPENKTGQSERVGRFKMSEGVKLTYSWKTVMACPSTTSLPPSAFTSPL